MMNTKLPLEDSAQDVFAKAMFGKNVTPEEVAGATGCPLGSVEAVLAGVTENFEIVGAVCGFLGLSAKAVVRLAEGKYHPDVLPPADGLAVSTTPFGDMTVNAFLVWDPGTKEAAVFDTGGDCSELLERAAVEGVQIRQVYLTHSHGDHIFDLDRLLEKTGATAFSPAGEPVEGTSPLRAGAEFRIGSLHGKTFSARGHSPDGLGFFIKGLEKPFAVIGDALFAGSMGGPRVSFADSLASVQERILQLPEETILCPGHGPLTTVKLEKANNPFA